MRKPKELPVKISINRVTQSGPDFETKVFMRIEVEDVSSHMTICNVDIEIEEFGHAISGSGYRDAKCKLFDSFSTAGMVYDHMTQLVYIPEKAFKTKNEEQSHKIIDASLSSFVESGWKFSYRDVFNHHNCKSIEQNCRKVEIHFHRYIKKSKLEN